MRKTTAAALAALGIVLVLVCMELLIRSDRNGNDSWSSTWSRKIAVSDGKADPTVNRGNFQIEKDGEYQLYLSWLPEGCDRSDVSKLTAKDAGFLTAVVISDAKGRPIFSRSATAIYFDTTILLDQGLYSMDFYYMTDREEFMEFARTYLCGSAQAELWAEDIDFASLQKSGSWTMDFELRVAPAASWDARGSAVLLVGILFGLCLLVLMLAAISKGKRVENPRYDERQELERGRGFRSAFFTLLICCGLTFCIDLAKLFPTVDMVLLYGFGVFLSLAVYCVYCVRHECYFALNQKTVSVTVCLALVGLFNLIIAVSNILSGRMFENGRVSFHFLNLLCAALFLVLALALLIKWLSDRKKAASGSEDGEETES